MDKKMIELENVSWQREGNPILTNINWSIKEGEHWAVLGLNGSGKTTLLNIVNGYIWPTTGNVHVLGKEFGKTDLRELRKSIGWVSSSLQERIRTNELVQDIVMSGKFASIGLYENPTSEDRDRAYEVMEQLNCHHLWGRKYETCSQGEKQKILIARGLMSEPKLLILDEPTSGLDFIAREGLLASIQQLAAKDAPTLIFVTHHLEEIMPVFSRTLLLRNGTVYAKGNTNEILSHKNLSDFYGVPVSIHWHEERAWVVPTKENKPVTM